MKVQHQTTNARLGIERAYKTRIGKSSFCTRTRLWPATWLEQRLHISTAHISCYISLNTLSVVVSKESTCWGARCLLNTAMLWPCSGWACGMWHACAISVCQCSSHIKTCVKPNVQYEEQWAYPKATRATCDTSYTTNWAAVSSDSVLTVRVTPGQTSTRQL